MNKGSEVNLQKRIWESESDLHENLSDNDDDENVNYENPEQNNRNMSNLRSMVSDDVNDEADIVVNEEEKIKISLAIKELETPPLLLKPFVYLCNFLSELCGNYKLECGYRDDIDEFQDPTKLLRENIIGLICGIIIGFGIYFLFLLTFSHSTHLSTIVSAYLMLLSVFGIAFSPDFRCVVLLTFPYLAASRVRWLILLYATSLSVAGPGLNFLHNSGNFRNSIACVLAQVSTNMLLLQKLTVAPFAILRNQLDSLISNLNAALNRIRFSLSAINFSVFRMINVMENQSSWINSIISSCGDKTALQNQCLAFFNNIYFNCRSSLGLFSFVCGTVRLFAADTCSNVEGLIETCDQQAKVLEDHVNLTSKENLTKIMNEIIDLIGKKNLSFDTSLYNMEHVVIESDNTVVQLLQNKMDSFVQMIDHAKYFISWILVIWTMITMLQLVIQAFLFRKAWLGKDTYQNVYITDAFIQQEKRAFAQDLVPTLPLVRHEVSKYKKLTSIKWTENEKQKAFKSLIIQGLWIFSILIVLGTDYAMYQVLLIVTPLFSKDFTNYGAGSRMGKDYIPDYGSYTDKPIKTPIISGKSSFANIVRALVDMLNPMKDVALDVDATACQPTTSPPNQQSNQLIILLLCLTVLSVFFEIYVLRIRHLIMIWYYPDRAAQRAAWLRTNIRNSRGLFHRLVHKFHTNESVVKRHSQQISCFGKFLSQNPKIRQLLEFIGIKRITCALCGKQGNPVKKIELDENFVQCVECNVYYCRSCKIDLEHICMLCRTPLFALSVEVDFEENSTDDEYEQINIQYLHKAEQSVNPHYKYSDYKTRMSVIRPF